MISLRRLEKLPRSARLRKIAQMFALAEQRMGLAGAFPSENTGYFGELLDMLARDCAFPPAAAEALGDAAASWNRAGNEGRVLRLLNTVRHILLSETGKPVADWDCIDHGGALDPGRRRIMAGVRVYLEDIRSPYNVGAFFRTAESFGVEKLILSPFCADPLHPRSARTAMGCVSILPWERRPLSRLEGPCFALETGGIPLDEFAFPRAGVLIAGSEELGVSPQALEQADRSLGRLSIPTFGAKGSLNVSVAFGIAMYAWHTRLRQRGFL